VKEKKVELVDSVQEVRVEVGEVVRDGQVLVVLG
jgi:hypothetical protein